MSLRAKDIRLILSQSFPLMLAQIGHNLMTLTDNVMLGRLGPKPLAALAVAHVLYVFFFLLAVGILSILRTFIAEARARGEDPLVGVYMRQGLLLCVPLWALCKVGFGFAKPIFLFFGQAEELIPYAERYLNVLIWGIPFIYGFVCLRQVNEGLSYGKPSMWLVILGALLNIPLNYVLIYGKAGFPKLGIEGAAASTTILSAIMFVLLLAYLAFRKIYKPYALFKNFSFRESYRLIEIIGLGLPSAAARMGEVGFFLSMALIMGSMGTLVLAGHQIAISAASFAFMIPLGMSFALTVIVADARGRRDLEAVRSLGWAGFLLGAMLMVPSGLIFGLFPQWIVSLYTDDPVLSEAAKGMIRIAGIFQIFDGLQICGIGILQGLKDTRVPFANIIFAFWVLGVPLCYLLGKQMKLQGVGVWTGALVALSLVSILHMLRFYYLSRSPITTEA